MNRKAILLLVYSAFAAILTFGQKIEKKEPGAEIKNDGINVEVFGGGSIFLFPTEFEGVYTSGNKFSHSFSPSVGISCRYMFPNEKRVGLGISLAYYQYKSDLKISDTINAIVNSGFFHARSFSESFKIENTFLGVAISFSYFINPAGRTKFFVRAGFLNNVSLGGTRKIISEYSSSTVGINNGNQYILGESGSRKLIDLSSSWTTIVTALGIKKGKSGLELNYSIPRDIYSSPSTDKRFRIRSYGFNYYYHLN